MRCWGELKSLRAQSVCEVSAFFSCAQFLAYVETKVSRRPTTSRNAGYAPVRKSSLCYICKVVPKKGSPFQPRSFLCTFSSPEPLGLKIKTTTVDEEPMTKSTLAHALVRQTAATN